MKKLFERTRNNPIFIILCAVLCAAAGTTFIYLTVMLVMGRYGDYHGKSYDEARAIASQRLAENHMAEMMNILSRGYAVDKEAVKQDPDGELLKLQEYWRETAEEYAGKGKADFAIIISEDSYLSDKDLKNEDMYFYESPHFSGYSGTLSGRIFYSMYYVDKSPYEIVLQEFPEGYRDYDPGDMGFGRDFYAHILYTPAEDPDSDVSSFLYHICKADKAGLPGMVGMILLGLIALVLFVICAGHRSGKEGISLNFIDRIPLEIAALILLFIELAGMFFTGEVLGLFIFSDGLEGSFDFNELVFFSSIAIFVLALWALVFLGTLAVRIKSKTFWGNTLFVKVMVFLWSRMQKAGRWISENIPLAVRVFIPLPVILIVSCAEFGYIQDISLGLAALFALGRIAVVAILLYLVWGYSRLRAGAVRMAEGKLDEPVNVKYLSPDFRFFAEKLNSVGESIQLAVGERMKSERMKTQLITNVSHDIKTPLTSIINYVDLLGKEDISEAEKKEYLEILAKQSDRLKKLIQDLIDASRASSGAMEVNMEETDLCTLVRQVVGEYQDKFEASGLTLISKKVDGPVKVMADSNLLWRVMDNLFTNALKYSMPGTRVYVETRELDGSVSFSISNVSKSELGISEDELMERFVRGDKSRNTEGSGLGLSIARSLMELMGGELRLKVDGDMFKAIIMLRR